MSASKDRSGWTKGFIKTQSDSMYSIAVSASSHRARQRRASQSLAALQLRATMELEFPAGIVCAGTGKMRFLEYRASKEGLLIVFKKIGSEDGNSQSGLEGTPVLFQLDLNSFYFAM